MDAGMDQKGDAAGAATASNASQHNHGHVKFQESQVHEPDIIVERGGPGADPSGGEGDQINVHLGFLQVHYRYQVSFSVPNRLGHAQVSVQPEQHLCIKNINVSRSSDVSGHDITLEFVAIKDGVMEEEFQLVSLSDGDNVKPETIVLHCRVLGRHKGTPLLKDGIHIIGMNAAEDESEASDWAGFE